MPIKADPIPETRFGRLVFLSTIGTKTFPSGKTARVWRLVCDCGTTVEALASNVRTGHTKSCGCLEIENRKTMNVTHGDCGKRMWVIYQGMMRRCHDPNSISYKYYGARGVRVLWASYEEFKRDMGESYRDGLTIGRKDSSGHYCKENCRWETQAQQNRNYSRNVNLTFGGRTMVMTDWAHEFCMKPATLAMRLKLGWDLEKALTAPVQKRKGVK
jgi:hypothetical protein